MTVRVAIYLRVSRDDQTVENQRLELERVAQARGWSVVATYSDEGISGAKGRDQRPGLDKLLRDAAARRIDLIAAWAIDRVGRSLSHLATMIDDLQAQGVGLYLHQQAIDSTTPSGKAMLQMCGVFAEFERSILRERINAGIARARVKGTKSGQAIGRPTVESTRRDIAVKVAEARAAGRGIKSIARDLGIGVGTVMRLLERAADQGTPDAA